jgi:hypothetical protein
MMFSNGAESLPQGQGDFLVLYSAVERGKDLSLQDPLQMSIVGAGLHVLTS